MSEENKTPDDKAIDEKTAQDIKNMGSESADKGKRKWVWGGAAVAATLVAVFAMSGGDDDNKEVKRAPVPPVVSVDPVPVPEPVVPQVVAPKAPPAVTTPKAQPQREVGNNLSPQERNALAGQSVQAKIDSIYWNEQAVMRDGRGAPVEAFMTADGKQVSNGDDFAAHVSLIDGGGVAILLADGPYAGSRLYVSPAEDSLQFSRVGEMTTAKDGRTQFYQLTGRFNSAAKDIYLSDVPGTGMAMDVRGTTVEKKVGGDVAFTVTGEPEVDGRIKVQLWNDDTVTVDFASGTVVVDSLLLADPDYLEKYDRTGQTTEPAKAFARIGVTAATPMPR